ncbi:MAG TPA: matrixin family metalloprotease, partial [Chthoniobacterales bacterium]|nr:matrixin family metalloprotease [Chthoniobacterales bacterium]
MASYSQRASAYSLNGKSWPSGTVTVHLGLGNPVLPLSDGSTTWNAAVAPALTMWNQQIGRVQLAAVMDSSSAASSGDRVNSVVFSNSVFGQSFGTGTLAVAYYVTQGSNLIEVDVLFNRAQTFDSYRGDLRFGGSGYALADIRRVFLHEMGHGIGLNHQEGDNIMAALVGDRETLSNDDIAGARAMYGAPAATPTPTPTPPP